MNGLQGLLALARGYMGAQAEHEKQQELLRREAERQALDEAFRQKQMGMQQEAFRAQQAHNAFLEGQSAAQLALQSQELAANEAWRQGELQRQDAKTKRDLVATVAGMTGRSTTAPTPAYNVAAIMDKLGTKGTAPAAPVVQGANEFSGTLTPSAYRDAALQELAAKVAAQKQTTATPLNVAPRQDTPGRPLVDLGIPELSAEVARARAAMPAGSELATAGANVTTSYRNPTETENLNASYLRDTQTARVGAAVKEAELRDYQVKMAQLEVALQTEQQPAKVAMLQEQVKNLVLQGEDMLSRRQLTDWQREAIRTTTLQGQRMFPAQLRQASAAATLAQMQPGVVSRELGQKDRALSQEDRRLNIAEAQMQKEVDALKQRGKDATDNERAKIAQAAAQFSLDAFKQDRENVLGLLKRAKESLGGALTGDGTAGLPTAVEMNGLLTVIEDHVKRGVYAQENADILKGMIYSVYKDVLAARSPAPTQ